MTLSEIIEFLSAEQRKFRAEKMSIREVEGKYRVVFYIPEHHLTKEVSIQQISENLNGIFHLIYPDLQDVLHSVVVTESVFEFELLVASESGEAMEG